MWETPPRSPTIVGMDVATMVWSSAAMSMPASRAEKIRLIRRRVKTIGGAVRSVGGACTWFSWGSYVGAAGARHRGRGRRRPLGECGWSGGSAGRRRQAGGEHTPRLVDERGQRGGEVGGQP